MAFSIDGVPYPILIISGENPDFNSKLVQEMSKLDFLGKVKSTISAQDMIETSSIILAEKLDMDVFQSLLTESFNVRKKSSELVIGQNFPIFIVHDNNSNVDEILKQPQIHLDQMIFFINLQDLSVYEAYQINGIVRRSVIGEVSH